MIIHINGIPGVGKSSIAKELKANTKFKNCVIIDTDDIRDKVTEQLLKEKFGDDIFRVNIDELPNIEWIEFFSTREKRIESELNALMDLSNIKQGHLILSGIGLDHLDIIRYGVEHKIFLSAPTDRIYERLNMRELEIIHDNTKKFTNMFLKSKDDTLNILYSIYVLKQRMSFPMSRLDIETTYLSDKLYYESSGYISMTSDETVSFLSNVVTENPISEPNNIQKFKDTETYRLIIETIYWLLVNADAMTEELDSSLNAIFMKRIITIEDITTPEIVEALHFVSFIASVSA